MAGDGQRLVAAHGVDLALHRVDVGDGREIEILAPDEGGELGEECFARRDVAGDRPGLDEGRPLPVLPGRLVIDIGRGEAHGGGRRAGIGPQAVIDPVDIAVAGALLQQLCRPLGEAGEERRRLQALLEGGGLGIEEDDQVDVARIVQLAPAELAEAQHHETGAGLRILTVGREEAAGGGGLEQHRVEGRADGGVREVGERRRHPLQRPDAADIGERHEKRVLGPVPAQRLAQRVEIGGGAPGRALVGKDACIRRVGRFAEQAREPIGLSGGERPEEGRVVGKRQEQAAGRAVAQRGGQRFGNLGQALFRAGPVRERRGRAEAFGQRPVAAACLSILPVRSPVHAGPQRSQRRPYRGAATETRNRGAFKGRAVPQRRM